MREKQELKTRTPHLLQEGSCLPGRLSLISNYVRCYVVDVSAVNNPSLNSLIKSFNIIHSLLPKLTLVIKNIMVIYSDCMTILSVIYLNNFILLQPHKKFILII